MLQDDSNFGFKYASFSLSEYSLKEYIQNAIEGKKYSKNPYGSYDCSNSVVDSIISCIASQDFSFDKGNKRIFKALYMMLRDYACDNGTYSKETHAAMRMLCVYCGFAPDSIVLTDRAPMGRMARLKQRIGKWFGAEEPRDAQEDKIDQLFAAGSQQKNPAKQDTLDDEIEKRRAELHSRQEKAEQKRIAEAQKIVKDAKSNTAVIVPMLPKKTKRGLFAKISATITGFVALGAGLLFSADNSAGATATTQPNEKVPTFKTVDVAKSVHYDSVVTYNMIDSIQKQKSNLDSVMQYRKISVKAKKLAKVTKSQHGTSVKQTVQAPKSQDTAVAITRASRSALNILIGTKQAQKLCDNIQSKVDSGIFKLPEGMSVERVAHAMQMSRIYEGHSVILDALKSDVKLTVEQQRAFNEHIASIGDLGVKLQKRMSAKYNLSKHSRYDKAKKTLRMAHAKNLKQLKQMKNYMR